MFSQADNEQTTPVDTEHIAGEILRLRNRINISKSNSAQNPANTRPDLKFVATVATGGRVKFLSAV